MNGHFGSPWFSFNDKFRFAPDSDAGTGGGKQDLDSIVNSAVDLMTDQIDEEAEETEGKDKKKDPPTDKKEKDQENEDDPDEEDDDDDDSDDEEDLSAEELLHAKNLFKSLKDPQAREVVIRALAGSIMNEAGTPGTKKEEKVVADVINEIFEQKLGNYKFLAKGISEGVQEVVELLVEERTQGIKSDIESTKEERLRNEIDNAMKDAFSEYTNVDKKVHKEILRVMNTLKPAQGVKPIEYFRTLTKVAAANLGITLEKKTSDVSQNGNRQHNSERINRNRKDASSRLASERTGSPSGKPVSTEKLSIEDSIKAAMETIDKQK